MKHIASLALTLLATSGCNLIQVKGLGGGSTPSSSSAPVATPAAGAPGGQVSTPKGARPDLVKAYLAVHFKDYEPTGYADAGVVARAGLDLASVDSRGKKLYAVTPDAAWLPGWNPASFSSRDLPMQVAQAGINRTWQAACFADYAAFRDGWTKIEAKLGPALAQARAEPNFYARTAALRDLYAAAGAEATAAGLEVPAAHPARWVGLRWSIARELLGAVTASQREAARDLVLGPIVADLPALVQAGRAWSADAALERDAFCLAAQEVGTQRTSRLPRPRQTGWELDVVTPPVGAARAQEVAAGLAPLLAADRPALTAVKVVTPETLPNPIQAPVLAVFDLQARPYVVDRVEVRDGKTVIHASTSARSAVGYDCRSTKQIESYTAGGQPQYRTACKDGTREEITAVVATFDELPPDGAVKKGAAIAFLAEVSAADVTQKVTGGGAKQTVRREIVARGRFVRVVRAAK